MEFMILMKSWNGEKVVGMLKGGFLCLACVVLAGCSSFDKFELPLSGSGESYSVKDAVFRRSSSDRLITGSFSGFPLGELWRILPDDVSYAYDRELADSTITMECKDMAVDDFLTLVSRHLGVDFVNDGNIYYIGKIDLKSFSVYVGRIGGIEESKINKIIDSVKTTEGKGTVLDGGLLVFSDRWVAVQRLNSVLHSIQDEIRNYGVNLWLVNDAVVRELYSRGNITGKYVFDWSAGSVASASNWSVVLNAVMNFSVDNSDSRDVRRFSSIVRDGEGFTYNNGLSVPVLRKTVSDAGTVTTSGVDYIDVGTRLDVKVMRRDDSSCIVNMKTEVSSNEREIEGYPVKNSSVYQSRFSLKHGDVVIVGKYETDQESHGIFGYKKNKMSYWVAVQVYVN